jgi:CRP/FNR family transcriptional regulator, nitrogen fixation regulation protein
MLNQSIATTTTGSNPGKLGLPETDEFHLVARHAGLVATEFFYNKDEEIYGEDEPGDYVYQVIRGAARSYKLLSDGRRQIGAFHLPGDIFGLESGPIHRLTAEAVIDTTVRLVTRRGLEKAAGTDVQVARRLWAMTSTDLRHAEDHMLLLGRKNARERVATFLLEMDRRLSGAGMMALPMCRRDIGDYLGLTLETVSRVLSQFQVQGMLGFSGARQILLRNRESLGSLDA